MTNAVLPTQNTLRLLAGLSVISVDQYSAVQPLSTKSTAMVNGIKFIACQDSKLGGDFTVPALTNLRIYGFESITWTAGGGTQTLFQFGYADDNAGTNFVMLFDILNGIYFGVNPGSRTDSNIITGLLTVPAGKIPQFKETDNTPNTFAGSKIIGLLTN